MAVAPVTDGKENQRAENYGAEEHEVRHQEEVKIIHVMGRGGCGVREKWNVKHHMSSRSSCLARLSCLSRVAYRLLRIAYCVSLIAYRLSPILSALAPQIHHHKRSDGKDRQDPRQ